MATRNFSSTAVDTTLSAGITASATTMDVAGTTGMPAAPFILAIDAGAATQELVLVTNVAGTQLTISRGYDSTVAQSHDAGAVVRHSHGAIDFREANTHVNASAGVHGLAGDVVGTTDTQSLTNKTFNLSGNTLTGTTEQFNTALSDGDFATLAGTETLSNKTLSAPAASGSLANFGGAWTAYTPTLTNFTGTITWARYLQIGKIVHVQVKIALTSAVSGPMKVSLPVAIAASHPSGQTAPLGTAFALDPGVTAYPGVVVYDSNSPAGFAFYRSDQTNQQWDASIPLTWASGDEFGFQATYEGA